MSASKNTAVILIDVYNDFIHPDGKMYAALKSSLVERDTVKHIRELVAGAHQHGVPIYYGLHQQFTPTAFEGWAHMQAVHVTQKESKGFEEGSWGAKILEGLEPDLENGDVVFNKHWTSSSFQNTDLDFLLRQHDITKVVIAGLTANNCVEATARYAYDLGYDVTLLSDATASWSIEQTKAATDLIWPLFSKRVITAGEYVSSLQE